MNEVPLPMTGLQDHAAFLAGKHDFQADIEAIATSDTVGVILETVMLATNMRFAAVARVTEDRWVACRTVDEINFGLQSGDEIEIQSTFCQTVRETAQNVLFNDAATDEVYGGHPIAAKFGIISYASIPIYRSNGVFFGTLCAIDTEQRDVKQPRAVAMLQLFADIIGRSLETEERLLAHEHLAAHEREMTKIQEEFVAVLGHDLRSPVAALSAGIRQLEREPRSDNAQLVLSLMKSSLLRMQDLIENMMLHAKSRLGGGIRVHAVPDAPLNEAIEQVVAEIRAAFPDRAIDLALAFDQPLICDAPRVAQAVSNLVSNAIRHTDPGQPVQVRSLKTGGDMVLQVINRGEAIPDHVRNRLFKPFQRGEDTKGEGLGLGLYIASSIAAAHGGRLDVACENGLTTFAFTLPASPGT
ncbi:GAF domain-containing sensor histidine kinase [Roseibium sp. AS2]|uniref:GAF domain-containing sensor histidine kinase n=1 Tax=Roseibium sp. AS2 TaxID=3135781 RepID=UPI00317049CD